MSLTDEEINDIVNEELEKDIDQSDSIDKEKVETHLSEMGFLWDTVQRKLQEDSTCFKCKKKVDFSGGKMQVLLANSTEKGAVSFVGVCEDCYKELEEEHKKKGEENEQK